MMWLLNTCLAVSCLCMALCQFRPLRHHLRRRSLNWSLRGVACLALLASWWLACQYPYPGYGVTLWFGLFTLWGSSLSLLLGGISYWLMPQR